MFITRWRTVRVALLRVCMEKSSNSLLGKAVRSRRALHVVGNALLQGDRPRQEELADLRATQPVMVPEFAELKPANEGSLARLQPQQAIAPADAWVPLLDPRQLLRSVINAKRLIGLLSLLGLIFGILFAMSLPKFYYSTAEILIDPRDLQISDREL